MGGLENVCGRKPVCMLGYKCDGEGVLESVCLFGGTGVHMGIGVSGRVCL